MSGPGDTAANTAAGADASPPPPDAPPQPGPPASARRSFGPIEKVLALIGALIGVLAGVTALIDWVSGLGGDPPPEIDARIEQVVSRNVAEPLGDYLDETRQPRQGYTADELRRPGYAFKVSVRIMGKPGMTFPVRWSLYRRPEARMSGRSYNQLAGVMTPESANHASSWPIWVPYPPRPGTYFVRVTLENNRQRPISEEDSKPFRHPPPLGG